MTSPEFSRKFSELVQDALKTSVPVPQIIHDLTMAKIELGHMYCVAIQQQRMHALAKQMSDESPKIIPNSN